MIDQVGDRNRLTIGEDVETAMASRQLGPAPAWSPNVWYETILGEAGKPSMIMSLKCAHRWRVQRRRVRIIVPLSQRRSMGRVMSASSQLFIAMLLSAVAFGCFAFAAGFAGRPRSAAVLAALVWLLVAVAVAFLVTVELID